MSVPALDGGCAQGAFGRAGFRFVRSANLRTAATLMISNDSAWPPIFRTLNHDQYNLPHRPRHR
ncbi:hypothetical protein C1X64_01740 [Pseudomonas sp. GW456-E7]|nr:hypothetical protein C1X64_01740 [Pseudomonas sp. GW456-E7]